MAILELINVNYKYEGSSKFVLKDVNAEFEIGKMYVIVGKIEQERVLYCL